MIVILSDNAVPAADWLALRFCLWPETSHTDHAAEIAAIQAGQTKTRVFAACQGTHMLGFAEISLRHDYVNGCHSSPVAFLEGIYVIESARRQGIARRLVDAGAAWARSRGITEFASDALLDNRASHAMHAKLGFAETERVVYFRKPISPDPP